MLRIVEQPDIAPADRRGPARLVYGLTRRLLPRPLERAVVLFVLRTLGRSRQHRLILSAYGGIALAIALAYTKRLLYGRTHERWNQPNVPLLAAGMVVLAFAVLGLRAVFAFPFVLRANWIFRVTAVHRPAAYFAAVRKTLFSLGVLPVWMAAAALSFALWPLQAALGHTAILGLVAVAMVYRSLHDFRKIPFACSYVPEKSNLKIKLGAGAAGMLFLCDQGVHLENWTLEGLVRYGVLFAILLVFALWSRRRTLKLAALPGNSVLFEDLPPAGIHAIDLHSDAARTGAASDPVSIRI